MPDYSNVTLCFSLPRSRSQWLAWLYRKADITSWHDPLNACSHPADLAIATPTDRKVFIADTSAILFHRKLSVAMPGARFLYVLRDPKQCAESMKRQTGFLYEAKMARMDEALRRFAAAAPPENVCDYDGVSEFARRHWPHATGTADPGNRFWDDAWLRHIDVPVRDQPAYPERRAALLRHDETR